MKSRTLLVTSIVVLLSAGAFHPDAEGADSATARDDDRILWEAGHPGGANHYSWDWEFKHDVVASPTGDRLFVLAESSASQEYGNPGVVTMAFEADTGDLLWSNEYSGQGPVHIGGDIAVAPDGSRLYVALTDITRIPPIEYGVTVAYDADTGDVVWEARQQTNSLGERRMPWMTIAVSPDGDTVYTADDVHVGVTAPALSGILTSAFDAATGEELWSDFYMALGWRSSKPMDMAVSPDGSRLFLTGWARTPLPLLDLLIPNYAFTTVAYDADSGVLIWETQEDADGFGRSIAVAPDGDHVFVTGRARSSSARDQIGTYAYDAASGEKAWSAIWGDANRDDQGVAVFVSPDGARVYVAGTQGTSNVQITHYRLLAYDRGTGDEEWSSSFTESTGGGWGIRAADLSPDGGTLVATGILKGFTTVAVETDTGTIAWEETLESDEGGSGVFRGGLGVAFSSDGYRVYGSGYSQLWDEESLEQSDVLVVAFEA